jgi:hypothetical protein
MGEAHRHNAERRNSATRRLVRLSHSRSCFLLCVSPCASPVCQSALLWRKVWNLLWSVRRMCGAR